MEHQVLAAKCSECGRLSYPPHFSCPACGGTRFEGQPITGEGTLLTFTRAYALPLDYAVRYITLGIVQMEQGVRATGRLAIDEPRTGMRVRARVGEVREIDDKKKYGLIFEAA